MKKHLLFSAAAAVAVAGIASWATAADYDCSSLGTTSQGARTITSLTLADDQGSESLTISDIQPTTTPHAIYVDKSDNTFTTKPGATVTITPAAGAGEWMHSYVYIDWAGDGFEFSSAADYLDIDESAAVADQYKLKPGVDLVAFTRWCPSSDEKYWYDTDGYVGENTGNNIHNWKLSTPFSFTIPADAKAGTYRMRYKSAWSQLDPKGTADVVGSNTLTNNGGCIVDFTLVIEGDEPEFLDYDLSYLGTHTEWGAVKTLNVSADNGQSLTVNVWASEASGVEKPFYVNKSAESVLSVTPGTTVTVDPKGNDYTWWHTHFYVDWNKDGFKYKAPEDYFNTTNGVSLKSGVDLVATTGWNIAGTWFSTTGNGTDVGGLQKPFSFTVPADAEPGEYRARFMLSRDILDPNGGGVDEKGVPYLKNNGYGGCIVDFTLEVLDNEAARNAAVERVLAMGLYVPGGAEITAKAVEEINALGTADFDANANAIANRVAQELSAALEAVATSGKTVVIKSIRRNAFLACVGDAVNTVEEPGNNPNAYWTIKELDYGKVLFNEGRKAYVKMDESGVTSLTANATEADESYAPFNFDLNSNYTVSLTCTDKPSSWYMGYSLNNNGGNLTWYYTMYHDAGHEFALEYAELSAGDAEKDEVIKGKLQSALELAELYQKNVPFAELTEGIEAIKAAMETPEVFYDQFDNLDEAISASVVTPLEEAVLAALNANMGSVWTLYQPDQAGYLCATTKSTNQGYSSFFFQSAADANAEWTLVAGATEGQFYMRSAEGTFIGTPKIHYCRVDETMDDAGLFTFGVKNGYVIFNSVAFPGNGLSLDGYNDPAEIMSLSGSNLGYRWQVTATVPAQPIDPATLVDLVNPLGTELEWTVGSCCYEAVGDGGCPLSNLTDGDKSTFWHSAYETASNPHLGHHYFTFDLKEVREIGGFNWTARNQAPAADALNHGLPRAWELYVAESADEFAFADNAAMEAYRAAHEAAAAGTCDVQFASNEFSTTFTSLVKGQYFLFVVTEVGQKGNWIKNDYEFLNCCEFSFKATEKAAEPVETVLVYNTFGPALAWTIDNFCCEEPTMELGTNNSGPIGCMIDNNPASFYHSHWANSEEPHGTHFFVVDQKKSRDVYGFAWTPRQASGSNNGVWQTYNVFASDNAADFDFYSQIDESLTGLVERHTAVETAVETYIAANAEAGRTGTLTAQGGSEPESAMFDKPVTGRYILVVITESNRDLSCCAELGFYFENTDELKADLEGPTAAEMDAVIKAKLQEALELAELYQKSVPFAALTESIDAIKAAMDAPEAFYDEYDNLDEVIAASVVAPVEEAVLAALNDNMVDTKAWTLYQPGQAGYLCATPKSTNQGYDSFFFQSTADANAEWTLVAGATEGQFYLRSAKGTFVGTPKQHYCRVDETSADAGLFTLGVKEGYVTFNSVAFPGYGLGLDGQNDPAEIMVLNDGCLGYRWQVTVGEPTVVVPEPEAVDMVVTPDAGEQDNIGSISFYIADAEYGINDEVTEPVTLTSETATLYSLDNAELAKHYSEKAQSYFIDVNINENGTYTLTIPEAKFKGEKVYNKATVVVWTINKNGITSVTVNGEDVKVYDLQGRRVNNVTKGRVYIINGVKTLVK